MCWVIGYGPRSAGQGHNARAESPLRGEACRTLGLCRNLQGLLADARRLLLAEFRLQRVHALLEGFLVFLLLLFADRLARRFLGFLGGSLLRL